MHSNCNAYLLPYGAIEIGTENEPETSIDQGASHFYRYLLQKAHILLCVFSLVDFEYGLPHQGIDYKEL